MEPTQFSPDTSQILCAQRHSLCFFGTVQKRKLLFRVSLLESRQQDILGTVAETDHPAKTILLPLVDDDFLLFAMDATEFCARQFLNLYLDFDSRKIKEVFLS